MGRNQTKKPLAMDEKSRDLLQSLIKSRTEPVSRVERAKMLLSYNEGKSIAEIAKGLNTNRPKVNRCVNKALEFGITVALDDFARPGRSLRINSAARDWLVSLACQKPVDIGYAQELWTTALLASHARAHCEEAGHPSLRNLSKGTVSKILRKREVKPHRMKYYLERRDPDFDRKMAEVLHVYKEVELLREGEESLDSLTVTLSYDEKPGIQAIGNTAPDLPPVPGKQSSVGRDHEYVRHGTMSLLAAIDLLTGEVHGIVEERHRSREFILFLQMLDKHYKPEMKIRLILDNHSAHTSKETQGYLATVPNRFEFVFTPTHGSWLNIIETFFSKAARTVLRGIRVKSKEDLKARIMLYLEESNREPVVFRWKYKMDGVAV